jgi:iron(III) transport system permease protein
MVSQRLRAVLRPLWHLLFNPDADPPRVIVGAAVAFAIAVLTPLLWVVLQALQIDPTTGLAVVTAPTTVSIAANSLLLVAAVTVLGVAIAVPLAFLTVLANLPHRRAWTVLVALPLVIPSYVGAFAYVSSVGPRGALAVPMRWLGLEVASIDGLGGTVLVLTLYTYPYVFLTTRAALISFNRRQLEAAWALQASTPRALVQVVIPQIIPAITAGALLAALYTLSDFGTPAIMRFDVFTRAIYLELNTFGVGRAHASVLALQLVALTAVILWMRAQPAAVRPPPLLQCGEGVAVGGVGPSHAHHPAAVSASAIGSGAGAGGVCCVEGVRSAPTARARASSSCCQYARVVW